MTTMPTTTGFAKPGATTRATLPACPSPPISPLRCPSPSTAPHCPPLPSSTPTNVRRSGTSTTTSSTSDGRVSTPVLVAPTPTRFGAQILPFTSSTKTRAVAKARAPLSPIVPPITPPRVSSTPSAPWAPRKPKIKASTWPRLQSPPSPTPCRLLFSVSDNEGPIPAGARGRQGKNSCSNDAQVATPRTRPKVETGRVTRTSDGKGRAGIPAMVKLERSRESPFLLAQPKIHAASPRRKVTTDKETTCINTARDTVNSDADETTAALAAMTIGDKGPSSSHNYRRAPSTSASRATNSTNSPASSRSTSPTWSTSPSSAPSPNLPSTIALPTVKPKVYTPRARSRAAAQWQIVENDSDDEDEDEGGDEDDDPFCRGSKPRVLWFGFEKTNVGVAGVPFNEKCAVAKKTQIPLPGDDWWLSPRPRPRRDQARGKGETTTGDKPTA